MTDPAVTTLLTSHMKGRYLREALESVLAQTRRDIHILVVDSGRWRDQPGLAVARETADVHADYSGHPLVEWAFTGEPENLAQTRCAVGWATNQAIRAGLVRGRYMHTFYDDDRLLPTFTERMAGFLDANPQAGAVWCSQFVGFIDAEGVEQIVAVRAASEPKYGAQFDCRVDGGQVMWRTALLDRIGDPWLPEDRASCYHSDGVFLDKLGEVCGIVPNIPDVLCVNRKTPLSVYSPMPV